MRKYALIVLTLLFVMNVNYAQKLFEDEDDSQKGFSLRLTFKYKDLDPVEVNINDNYGFTDDIDNHGAGLKFQGTGCYSENSWRIPIANRYSYDLLRQYLVDIDIRTFKPHSNAHDVSSDLQIKFMYLPSGQMNYNTFHWNYNPDNVGDENQILTYLLEVLNDNVSRTCARDYVELLETYIEAE